jgi:hypothetical protein
MKFAGSRRCERSGGSGEAMLASILMTSRLPLLLLLAGLAAGCTSHASAAMAVDTPLLPYQAPDIAELTGDDLNDDGDVDTGVDADEAPSTPPAVPAKPVK